ncbi:PEP-CTERM sorting domain-containing protein [uncultured Roseobacter sp.]|uniref:PEP-CTERM sorting domain-containing protein n=1 Tax=uncultured Roseobacter sp. TaxID=114847 RepID=UPI002612D1F4|nr:PEP-CTERM sorting domain-containing protein [uncultured Roseobacter sp.]
MKHLSAFIASLLLLAPISAQAASVLVYEATGEAIVDVTSGTSFAGAFFDLGSDDIDVAAEADTTGATVDAGLFVSSFLSATGVLLESTTVVSSDLTLNDPDNGLATEDFFTVVFGDLSGDDAGLFGDTATVVFSFFEETAAGDLYSPVTARVYSDLTPVPAPAALPLLMVGLGGLVALRRRAKR